jgi:hypothetical protein
MAIAAREVETCQGIVTARIRFNKTASLLANPGHRSKKSSQK